MLGPAGATRLKSSLHHYREKQKGIYLVLNLNRVTLDVFEYNPRAIRSYENAGFKHEGRGQGWLKRDRRRWDLVYMGILRNEWEELQKE
jgi:RimJ/RimL family protein N-acetyltransferase